MNDSGTQRAQRKVYTVSRLMQDVQQRLESGFGTLWLQGELSNVARPGSGHLYFSVKDSRSQIRCAMFKGRNRYIDFEPQNGDAVLVRGTLGLYAARGDFQLIVEHMEPAGAGQLQAAFEALKRELHALGRFSVETKRPLPASPGSIGVITSPTGAALRDVLQVLRRRYPQGRVVLYPTMTQGAQAASDVVRALERASRRRDVDVLLLVRGGGSLEDLQAFNERSVAEAIHACPLPLVSGVGHEVDITIADLVADVRAPTPSAAAELAVPDGRVLVERSARAADALRRAMARRLDAARRSRTDLHRRLAARHPERLLMERARHLDDLVERLHRVERRRRGAALERWGALRARLMARHPQRSVQRAQERRSLLERRLTIAVQRQLERQAAALQPLARALEGLGPQAVLARGYAFLQHQGEVLTRVNQATPGTRITARLLDGELDATVDAVRPEPAHENAELFPGVTTQPTKTDPE